MKKRRITIRVLTLLRLISIMIGYNFMLLEAEVNYFFTSTSEGQALIIRNVHPSWEGFLYAEDSSHKNKEHTLEISKDRVEFKKRNANFWKKLILTQNQKPGSMATAIGRVLHRYRQG